jgi:hypothetical protein
VMDEQGTYMQLGGLDLKELEAQRTELLPERIVMRRKTRRRKGGWTTPYCPDEVVFGVIYACVPRV